MSGAVTATVAVVAAMTTAEIFTAVAITGAVVGAIGAATHVKELQYAGMALGAVGAIGGLAASAGLFAADALANVGAVATGAGDFIATGGTQFGSMADLAATGLPGAVAGFDMASGVAGVAAAAPGAVSDIPTTDVINMISGQYTGPGAALAPDAGGFGAGEPPDVVPTVADNSGGWMAQPDSTGGTPGETELLQAQVQPPAVRTPAVDPADVVAPGSSGAPPVLEPTPQPAVGPQQVDGTILGKPGSGVPTLEPGGGVSAGGQPVSAVPVQGGPYTPAEAKALAGTLPSAPDSVWTQIMSTVGKPGVGTLLGGAIQAGGAFIAGATSTLTPAQVAALQAQARYNQAASGLANQQAALLQQQQTNLTGNIPGVSRTTPVPAGLINRPPPVTGAPTP